MQTTTSGSKEGVDISYTFSQKTTVPEKGKKILKLFQDNLKRYLARLWRTWEGNKKKKTCGETVWYRWKWKLMMMVMMMMMRNLKIRQVEVDTMRQTCSQQRSWLPKSTKSTFESWFRGCHKIEFKESLVYQESQFNTVFIWYTWQETPLKALADLGEGRGGPGPPLSQSLNDPPP